MKPPREHSGGAEREGQVLTRRAANPLPTADSSALYRLLVQSVRDYAIFALDATGHILTWNEGAERLKGYKPAEIIGKHFSAFYDGSTSERRGTV